MQIQVLSDLHLPHWISKKGPEWYKGFLESTSTKAEVLVLAGDIVDCGFREGASQLLKEYLTLMAQRHRAVVYVPGNHEFYGSWIYSGMQVFTDLGQLPMVFPLQTGELFKYDAQRFMGDTMWMPPPKNWAGQINDHYVIADFPKEAHRRFDKFQAYLEAELHSDMVVVTHHAPSNKSIAPQFLGEETNRWFITPEVEALIVERQPMLWIHGHTHSSFDYRIGATRVVANPMGYPGEATSFNPQFTITLEDEHVDSQPEAAADPSDP